LASPENPEFEPPVHTGGQQTPSTSDGTPFHTPDMWGVPEPRPNPPARIEDPVWNGWDVLLIAFLTFIVVTVLQFASAKAAQLLWYPRMSLYQAAQQIEKRPLLLILSQILVYIPVALLMIAMVEGKYRVPFWRAIYWNWPRTLWKWIVLGAALLLTLSMFESLLPMPKDTPFEHLFDRPLDAYLLAAVAITLGPLMEELFFRGLLYPVLARRLGMVWGVLLSALPFALLHLPQYAYAWAAGLVILAVGIVCGFVRATTRSVGASFLVHVGYNGTQMLIAIAFTHGFTHMPKGLLQCFAS
jgi:membrane protease YdiL (CAAX protease family)